MTTPTPEEIVSSINDLPDLGIPIRLIIVILLVVIIVPLLRRAAAATGKRYARFRNPANGYEEDVNSSWLWCFLFGPFYFALKGVWNHAVFSFALALLSFFLTWLIYPFFARGIIEKNYLRKGWIPVEEQADF